MEKLNKEQIGEITHAVIVELGKQNRHSRRMELDERKRNTKMLLREYRKLKAHVDANPEVYLTDDEYKMLTGVAPEPRDLAKYHVKTQHMLQYVDQILRAYEATCKAGTSVEQRRWQIVEDSYIAEHRVSNFHQANRWGVDESIIRKQQTTAAQELSVMLFGVAGLKDFLDQWLA
jgi:hypothetical protein